MLDYIKKYSPHYILYDNRDANVINYILDNTKSLNKIYDKITMFQRIYHLKTGNFDINNCIKCNSSIARFNNKKFQYTTCIDCQKKQIVENGIKTKIRKYGSTSMKDIPNAIEKMVNSTRKKFGGKWSNQTDTVKQKRIKTCIEKYGVDHNMKTNDMIIHMRKNTFYTTEKGKEKFLNWTITGFKNRLDKRYELVEYIINNNNIILYDKIFDANFQINKNTYSTRKCRNHIISTIENPIKKGYSIGEKELLQFVKSILPNDIILNNDRKHIKPYNVDILVLDKNIIIEYFGDYWHANPILYDENKILVYHNVPTPVKTIWEYDNKRKLFCENSGYKYIIVWEYDWLKNKDYIKSYLKSILLDELTIP